MNDMRPATGTTPERIDPDPVSVAAVAIAGATLILQFVQTWRTFNPQPHRARHRAPEVTYVEQMEEAVSSLQRDIRKLTRAIDRGSVDPEREFYRAPLRLAENSLNLAAPEHQSFSNGLAESYQHLSQIARWTNHMISQHPELAAEIGGKLDEPLTGAADRLNSALVEGRAVGEVVAEFRGMLEIMARVLEDKLREREN